MLKTNLRKNKRKLQGWETRILNSVLLGRFLTIFSFTFVLIFCFPMFLHAQATEDLKILQKPKLLYTFEVPGVWVLWLAISPDGRTLAGGGAFGGTVHLWDLKTGQEVATLEMAGGQVRAVAFSPDKRWIAAGMGRTGSKGFIHLLDARNWKVVRTLEGHSGSLISKLAFSRDAKKLVSGSTDVKVWDVDTGRALHSFKGGISKIVPVDVSPGGQVLAHGSQDSGNPEPTSITIRDLQSGQILRTLKGHTGYVESVTFSPDGRLLASGGWDRTIKVWDVMTGRQMFSLEGHSGNAQPIAFTEDSRVLVSVWEDSSVRLWNVENGRPLNTFLAHKGYFVSSIAISPDNRVLCTGGTDRTVKVWEFVAPAVVAKKEPQSPVDARVQAEAPTKVEAQVTINEVFLAAFEKPETPLNHPQRGQKVKMVIRYTVAGISGGSRVNAVERRRISYGGEQLAETEDQRQLEMGKYETFRSLTLPEQTPGGNYKLQGVIQIDGKEITREFAFSLE